MKKINLLILAILFKISFSAFAQNEKIAIPLRFDHYYTYEQVVEAIKALNESFPSLTSIEELGKSDEGRAIWALTINNKTTGSPGSKPGVYVDGNFKEILINISKV